MSDDAATNTLIRDLVMRADRFASMGHSDAAEILLYTARRAIQSPQETAPVHHYALDIRRAIHMVFGHEYEMGDLSTNKMLEGLGYWEWYARLTGKYVDSVVNEAIACLLDGAGWEIRKETARAALLAHPMATGQHEEA